MTRSGSRTARVDGSSRPAAPWPSKPSLPPLIEEHPQSELAGRSQVQAAVPIQVDHVELPPERDVLARRRDGVTREPQSRPHPTCSSRSPVDRRPPDRRHCGPRYTCRRPAPPRLSPSRSASARACAWVQDSSITCFFQTVVPSARGGCCSHQYRPTSWPRPKMMSSRPSLLRSFTTKGQLGCGSAVSGWSFHGPAKGSPDGRSYHPISVSTSSRQSPLTSPQAKPWPPPSAPRTKGVNAGAPSAPLVHRQTSSGWFLR